MRFVETPIPGAYEIELDRHADDRGFFARTYCRRDFLDQGLEPDVVQASVSFNHRRHTLRGMHYQRAPHGEAKVVRCVAGTIHDVIVDLRRALPTYRRWHALELSARAMNALYIPRGVAHGFLTLEDGATVLYQMSTEFVADAARGVRWNDPALAIAWPAPPAVISERDANYPLLTEVDHG